MGELGIHDFVYTRLHGSSFGLWAVIVKKIAAPNGAAARRIVSMSHSLVYRYMKNSKEKIPDCLVDFCKRSSINQMAAGSRPPRSSHGIFSPFY